MKKLLLLLSILLLSSKTCPLIITNNTPHTVTIMVTQSATSGTSLAIP